MDKLGIIFLYHTINDAVIRNYESIILHNPDAEVFPVSASESTLGGYSLKSTPELEHIHSLSPNKSSDVLLCSWYKQRQGAQCSKWWIVEWDTFCAVGTREYYSPVWQFPFVASSACLRNRQPEWYWFRVIPNMPAEYQPYAIGASPFIYLIDEDALAATCTLLLSSPLRCGNAELRFATAANRCGFPVCGFSPPDDQITWIAHQKLTSARGVFHPVKTILDKPSYLPARK